MKTKTVFLLALALALIPLLGRAAGPFQAAQGSDVQTASVGQIPTDIVLDEAGGKLYVANFGSGTVSVLDAATLTMLGEIKVGANPNALAIHPARHRVYVLNQGSDTLSVINTETDRAEATVRVGRRPWAMALDERADRLYVVNRRSGDLSVIEGHSLEVSQIPVGKRPVALALDDRGRVYVANQGDSTVAIVEPGTGRVATIPVGREPKSLAYNPLSRRVYASSQEPVVSVIDTDLGREVERMLVSAKAALAVDPTDGMVYLADTAKLLAFGPLGDLLWAAPLPDTPTRIVPDGQAGKVYVSHWNTNALSVVDTTTRQVETVGVGANPSAILLDRPRGRVLVVNTAYPAAGKSTETGAVSSLDRTVSTERVSGPASNPSAATATIGGQWTTYQPPDTTPGLQQLIVAADDTVWIGADSGVWHFDGNLWVHYTVTDGLADDQVQALAQSTDGALWFGTRGYGVSRFDGTTWTTYTTADGLADNNVQAIAQAADGALWFGTYGGGVSRFDGVNWTTYTAADGLAGNDVRAIAAAPDGATWFGTWGDGVSRFDGVHWTTYTTADGLASNYVNDLAVMPDGRVWAYSYIFSIMDGGRWFTSWLTPLAGGYGLVQDTAGNLWSVKGTLNGYDGVREYQMRPEGNFFLSDLALDSQGNKWTIDSSHLFRFKGDLPDLKLGSHVLSVADPGQPQNSASLESARNTGFPFVQVLVSWADLEPAQGQYEWGLLQHILDQTDDYDLFPVLRITGAPNWARSGTVGTLPVNPQYLEDFMYALVRRFGSQFAYSLWNEPNLSAEWWGLSPNASDYVTLLQSAYQGAKRANPLVTVVSAGLAPAQGEEGIAPDITFLAQMYDAGLADACDVVGMNAYGFAYSPDDTSDPNGYNFSRLADLRQVMVDKGDGDKPVWILEAGWMRDSDVDLGGYNWFKVSERQQALYLARAIDKARTEWPWVEAIFLWNLDYDRFLPETDPKYWFSFGQSYGYLAVAQMWPPYFHNPCGVTNQARPALRGSAPTKSIVTIYLDGTELLTTTAAYSGTFAVGLGADLSAGTHVLTATATNPFDGRTSDPSAPLALTVDSTLHLDPVGVYFTYQHPGSNWTGVRTPRDDNGCAVPGDWSVSLVPGDQTVVHVPVACTENPSVLFIHGDSNAIPLNDGNGDGWYEGAFTPSAGENAFSIVVICGGDTTSASGTLLIDPDGVVYDSAAGLDAPLSDVTVTCERYESSLDVWALWDAWNYPYRGMSQINPQETGTNGYYSFMVPAGLYKIKATRQGYLPFTSRVITVTDEPVHLDIPLERQPEARSIYLPLILKNR